MFAENVCALPRTGGTTSLVVLALGLLLLGVMATRWLRASANRLSIVIAPLVILGGLSVLTPSDSCVQTPAPKLAVVLELPAAPTPLIATAQITPDAPVTVRFGGFVPGEYVQLIVASTPKVIGSGYADADGFVTLKGKIPEGLTDGNHTLAVFAPVSGIGFSQPITVASVSTTTTTVAPTTTTVAPTTTTTSLASALTPLFGTPTSTGNGFVVQISNYDASFTWVGSATSSGQVAISSTGLVTVTGVAPETISTVTITTTKTGHAGGSAEVAKVSLAPSCASGTATCILGDTGPGGGIIFYIDLDRPAGSRYFEAACGGWATNCDGTADPNAAWGCKGTLIQGANGTAIGTGEQNTADIVAECNEAGTAARLASDYTHNGVDDWFFYSDAELDALYYRFADLTRTQRELIGFFNWPGNYSNSTQYSAVQNRYMYMDQNGPPNVSPVNKDDNNMSVRPIRSF